MAHLYYPSNLVDTNLHPSTISFRFHDRKTPRDDPPSDTIDLYMPESAQQPNTVSWDTEKFGIIGNTLANAGSMLTSPSAIFSRGGQLVTSAAGHGVANMMASFASKMGGRVSAEGLMGETTGRVPNPYITMVFRNVDFRNFAFTFRFFPFTESDSDRIHEIIKTFRKNSLPPGAAGDAFLKYPKEVYISYMWKGEENKYLHKFKKAVITGLDVDYTPNNMFSVMRNGMPSCIELKLKFSEIEIVLRPDVDKGY